MKTTKDNQTEGYKSLTLDIDYYQSLLDDPEVSEDQKREYLETIWPIVVQFIDWGYGIHPVQQTDAAQTSMTQSLTRLIEDVAQTHFDKKKETALEGADL
ncbi:MAG: hypothetical protein AAGA63_09615 [Pseudomonadota bacterium]